MLRKRLAVLAAALAMVATALTVTSPAGAQGGETCNGKVATIVGTDGPDRIEGTEGNDVIVGGADKDVIFGRGGNDTICGGFGNDVIKGGRGNDYVEGNQGNDKLIGGIGKDTMSGGSGKDKVFGGGGPDTLSGGPKKDAVRGNNGNDTCDLDDLDFFSTCEMGDVIGQTAMGDDAFTLSPVPASFALKFVDFGALNALQETDIFQSYAMEFYWEADPDGFGARLRVFDAEERLMVFEAPDAAQGLYRVATFDKPVRVEVEGVVYHETVVLNPQILRRLPLNTQGGGPDVFRLDPPTSGPTDFVFNFDGTAGFTEIEFFGNVDEFEDTFFADAEQTQLADTTSHGVRIVAVDGFDWTLALSEAG